MSRKQLRLLQNVLACNGSNTCQYYFSYWYLLVKILDIIMGKRLRTILISRFLLNQIPKIYI